MARNTTPKDEPAELPESVTLESTFSWYDDDGARHFYAEGQIVLEADQIAALLGRKAPLVGIE